MAAIENDARDRYAAQRLHQRRRDRTHPLRALHQVVEPLDDRLGAALLIGLHAIGLDVTRALKHLIEQRGQAADLDLGIGRDAAHAPPEPRQRPHDERKRRDRDQRQHPVLIEHQRDQADRRHRFLAEPGENCGRRIAQHAGVVDEARDQRAGRVGVKEGEVGAHHPREQRVLDVGDDALAHRHHQHRLTVAGDAFQECQRDHPGGNEIEQCQIVPDEHLVEHWLHQPGIARRRRRDDGHAGERGDETQPVTRHVVAHQPPQQRHGRMLNRTQG